MMRSKAWFEERPSDARIIVGKVIKRRRHAGGAQGARMTRKSSLGIASLPGKLADC